MRHDFTRTGLPGIWERTSNNTCYAGNVRLFGAVVHTWNNMIGGRDNDWADHRVWTCGLIALHHVTPGKKSTEREGWSLTFCGLTFKRVYRGFELRWHWADSQRTRKDSRP